MTTGDMNALLGPARDGARASTRYNPRPIPRAQICQGDGGGTKRNPMILLGSEESWEKPHM